LGWITVPSVGNGTYTIPALETGSGIKIRGTDRFYYVERRTYYGFDTFMPINSNVYDGFLVHDVPDEYGLVSYLLDMTPETSSIYDVTLVAPRSFTDRNITITAISPTQVTVNIGPICVKFNPKGKCLKWQ